MSLFQCQNCGCCENTALSFQGFHHKWIVDGLDWTGIEDRKGKQLCSACGPAKFRDGTPTKKGGQWHGQFPRTFLPMGMFKTNQEGNLEHIESGSTKFHEYEIEGPK
jgi:hypothetical protein